MTRLLATYGVEPDMVMGHSLGEYGALVAAGALDFGAALAAVSARGNEMTRVSVEDYGKMAAVFAPLEQIERSHRSGRWLRRGGQHQQHPAGGHRRRQRRGGARHGGHASRPTSMSGRCRSATPFTPPSSRPPRRRCGACSSGSSYGRRGCRPSPTSPATSTRAPPTPCRRSSTCSRSRSPRRCSSSRGSRPSTRPAPASSSRSARSAPSMASCSTCSASVTTSRRCSPITPVWVTRSPSTAPSADCGQPATARR